MEKTAERIKEAMKIREMSQSDIIERTGINKGALSSYISGRYKPKQTNTYLLAKALNVSEAWIMGEDVPMERPTDQQRIEESNSYGELECMIAEEARKLNQKGKIKLLDTAREMACNPLYNPDYQVELAAAHERTDTKVTEEARLEDDAIMHNDSEWE